MEYRPGRGIVVWRGVVVALMLVVALLTVAVVALFNTNHDSIKKSNEAIANGKEAITKNRNLGCSIGAFLVGIPIVKQPGTSQKTFEHSVAAAEDFLHNLKALDCKGLGKVTTAAINKQLHALHKIVPEGGGGSTGNPHSPGSLPGGGPSSAPPPPSSAPPSTTPSPPPPTTTPNPAPPPARGIVHMICHLDPLLGRICVIGRSR